MKPRLRARLAVAPTGNEGIVALHDPLRITPDVIPLPIARFAWLELMTGARTLEEIQSELATTGHGIVSLEELTRFVNDLDGALFLDNATLRDYLEGPIRRPSCIGCYPPEPEEIRKQLAGLFPKTPATTSAGEKLRAVLAPHIDYARGGLTYGHAFQEVARTDAKLFFIIATAHYTSARFTLTRKNFETPLGVVNTDQKSIDCLVAEYGEGLFEDTLAHLPEHSIELEVLLLQYLFPDRDLRIVPLLVGSFHDQMASGEMPEQSTDIARMVTALQKAEAEAGEPVFYLISGDLAHIGPKFQDPRPVDAQWAKTSREQDESLLRHLQEANISGYYQQVAAEQDARRICGLSPTWLTLQVIQPRSARVLAYDQYVEPAGHESVSFASVAFYE